MADRKKSAGGASQSFGSIEDALRLTMELCRDPKMAPIADSVASTLLAVIATGPSVATLQSLIAANQASGAMFHNAVANQQMTNVLGMAATMSCVQTLLDRPGNVPWPDIAEWAGGASDDEG
ncbi:RebB family R body protein [Phenylobacterium sp.]|uniref:RebB family R body protein n=1 Tax=Phenylobacterium sp. TaxID=1871053 RepID=UPI003566659F